MNLWLKEIAPSTVLRKWFAHDPAKWKEFVRRYHRELDGRAEAVASVQELARQGLATLVYAARDEAHNNAVALRMYLAGR